MQANPTSKLHDLLQTLLVVAALGSLALGTFQILEPFFGAFIWATMIVIATWPLMVRIQKTLRGSRHLATTVMSALLLLLLFVPMWISISTIVLNMDMIQFWLDTAMTSEIPHAPQWLAKFPFAGASLTKRWEELRITDRMALGRQLAPYLAQVGTWFVSQVGSFGLLFAHFLLTVIISAALFLKGERAAAGVLRFAESLAGAEGRYAMILAAKAVRAVALGIVITALVQSGLAGLGLILSGIPYVTLLVALIFVCGVAQIGPVPIMAPVIIWLFWSDSPGWAIGMLIWTIILIIVDNALRPALIKRGADLPLSLVFVGVMGGLLSYGIIGLFVGPVVLAVTYTLLTTWMKRSSLQAVEQA